MNYPPARKLIDAGSAIALASDFNPGSSPSGNMNMVVSMSCIQMRMLPEEAINAATINGAYAMELQNEVGSITIGKKANFIFIKTIPSLAYLPYAFGDNLIDKVMITESLLMTIHQQFNEQQFQLFKRSFISNPNFFAVSLASSYPASA
jgi:imidazolonepropionase